MCRSVVDSVARCRGDGDLTGRVVAVACDVFAGRYGRAVAVKAVSPASPSAVKGREGPEDRLLVDLVAHFAHDGPATVIQEVCQG